MDGHVLGSFHIFLHLIPLLNITFFSLYFYGRLKPPHWSTNTADGVEIWTQASWTVSTSLMIQTKCPDLAGIQKSKQECWSRQTSARITLQGGKRAVLLPCPGFHLQSQACTLAAKGKLQSELFFTHANPLLLEQHLAFCPQIRSTCRCHQPPAHLCSGWTLSYPAAERRMRTYMCTVRIQLSQLTRKHWMELPLPPEVVLIFFFSIWRAMLGSNIYLNIQGTLNALSGLGMNTEFWKTSSVPWNWKNSVACWEGCLGWRVRL